MEMIKPILWIILAHYLADYPLQGSFLATTKGKYLYSLFAHCAIYSLFVAFCLDLMGLFAIWKVAVLFISHMLIDYWKSHSDPVKGAKEYLYIDQILHISINIILVIV